jgi:chemotaxis protein histidine kinase CheA
MHNERYAIDFFITLICQRDFVEKINTSRTFSECLFSEYFMGRLRVTTAKELSSECSFGLLRFSMLEKYALRILSQSTEAVDALNKASSEIKLTITILVIEGLIANHLMNRVYDKINVSECVIGFILKALPENIAEIEAMFVTNPEVKKILKEAKQKQKKQAKKERDLKKKLEKAKAKEKESKILEDEAREAERRAQKAFEEKREMERMIEIRALEEKTQREALEKAKRESLTKGSNRERKPRIEADIEITEETLRERMKHVEEYLSESESARLASEFNLYHRLCELITKNSPESLATYLAKSSPSPSEKESFREFFKLAKELQETVEKNKTDFSKAIKNRYWHDRVLERINQILSQAENRKMHDILPLRIEPTVEAPHTLPAREKAIRDFKKLHGTSGTVVSAGDGDGKPLETSRHELALAFMRKRVEAPTSSLSILPKPLGLASDFPGREAEQRFSIAETGTLKQIFESYEKISSTYALIIASPEEELMLQTTRNHYAHTPCLVEALSPEGLAWLLDQWQKEDRQAFIPIIHDYFNHLSLEDKALLLDRRIFWLSQTCNPKIISFLLAEIWEIGQASFFEKSGLYHLNERDRNLLRQLRNQTWHEIYGSDKSLIEEDSYQKMHTLFSRHASRAEENLSRRYQEDALGFHPHAS